MPSREGGFFHDAVNKPNGIEQPKDNYPDLHPRRSPDVLDETLKSESLEVRPVSEYKGRGLFARKPFKTGDLVFTFDGRKELLEGDQDNFFSIYDGRFVDGIVVGEESQNFFAAAFSHPAADKFIWAVPDENSPLRWVNHSCEPNIARHMNDVFTFFATRKIPKGSQLTADYSLLECNPNYGMRCSCGSQNCRHKIEGIPALPAEYIARHWQNLPPFMRWLVVNKGQDARIRKLFDEKGGDYLFDNFSRLFLPKGTVPKGRQLKTEV
ncbi:MAG: SET domain-containing protein [Candidatus Magasanikbacteria bacterium]|nr:SET domain-containing protein [Candidatus Magasanikbacteria bacterium]